MRVDSHIQSGSSVPPFYDSMIAKVIVHGASRREAVQRMRIAIDELEIDGLQTNVELLRALLRDEAFDRGSYGISYLEQRFANASREAWL